MRSNFVEDVMRDSKVKTDAIEFALSRVMSSLYRNWYAETIMPQAVAPVGGLTVMTRRLAERIVRREGCNLQGGRCV